MLLTGFKVIAKLRPLSLDAQFGGPDIVTR